MPLMIEVTCRDAEVNDEMRCAALLHSGSIDAFHDLVRVCHVIIRARPGSAQGAREWSIRINLVLAEGLAVAANLLDRHRWFDDLDEALHEAFRELRAWLREAAPAWRARLANHSAEDESVRAADEQGGVEDLIRLDPLILQGTHHYVG